MTSGSGNGNGVTTTADTGRFKASSTSTSAGASGGAMGQGLKGVEALTLDYNVQWPVSLVLSRRAITKYQLISRLLFFSKHVELRVSSCWIDHQSTRELNVRGALGKAFCLRHRMMHFMQNFVYVFNGFLACPRHALCVVLPRRLVCIISFLYSCLSQY